MDVYKLAIVLYIAGVENRNINVSSCKDKSCFAKEPERLISPTAKNEVLSRFYKIDSSMNHCILNLQDFINEYNEIVKMNIIGISLLNDSSRELNEKLKANNKENTILKQTVQEQHLLIKRLHRKIEEMDKKLNGVRIVNGSSRDGGRVEIFKNAEWRSVCSNGWDRNEANVTCRRLGYSRSIPLTLPASEEGRKETQSINYMECRGTENSLLECDTSRYRSNCYYGQEAGVHCYNSVHNKTRIVNGSSPDEGLVEILLNGRWRSVCHNGWDTYEADVTCKSLGYSSGIPFALSPFGEKDTWFLNRINCNGNEESLLECAASGSTLCSAGQEAGVICYTTVKNVTRIVNGSSPDEGLVEVLVNDQWRNVCDYGWSKYDADVACKSLGYIGGIPFSSPILREGKEDTWFLANLNCNGNEDSLLECWSAFTTCKNGEQAGAVCYREENDVTRIVNGSSPNEGVVEVLINGQWRSVCNYGWDKRKTDVTCKGLGYSGGFPVSSTLFVQDKEEMWMLDVTYCSGYVKSLLKCSSSVIRSSSCHGEKAGVVCYHAEKEIVRFAQETFAQEKIVVIPKILINGSWRTLCRDKWQDSSSKFLCKSLGYSGYQASIRNRSSNEEHLVNNIRCSVSDRTFSMCKFDLISPGDCKTNGSVETVCYSGDVKRFIRLVNGESSNEGRVEVFIKGEWGTVCDYSWDSSDARALCSSLGYTGNSVARRSAYFGRGSGPIWMSNVNCPYRESSFFDCPYREYGNQNCRHSNDAGVTCE